MRRRVLGIAGAAAVVVMIVAGLSLRGGTHPVPSSESPSPTRTAVTGWERVHAVPTPPPSGSLRIHGTVRDEHGPVVGVRVSATRPTPGETLSELPCPAGARGNASGQEKKLPACLDEAGDLVLELVTAREGEAPVYAETVTATDGGFVLDGLPEGDFTLWALGEHGAQQQSGVRAGAQDVELVLNEGVTLQGIVVDQDDEPLAGVDLTILHEKHTRFFDTRSGPDGHYRVGPLPKGLYGITAEHEGWLPTFEHHMDLSNLEGKVFLVRPSRLTGRVLLDGAPAPDVEVSVKARRCVTMKERKLRTDAQGRFTLERVGPCTYDFSAERDGLYAVGEADVDPRETPPELVLNLGQAIHIEGTVRDDARQPVAGVSVSVSPAGGYLRSWELVTTEDGHFRAGPLDPGTYEFTLELPGYVDVLFEQHVIKRGMGPLDLTLRRAAKVSGVVVDEEGRPVSDIRIQLSAVEEDSEEDSPSGDSTDSDEEGRFSLDAPRAGAWELRLEDSRFVQQSLSIQAPASDLRIVMRRGATVMGTVTDEQAVPQERAFVTLWRAATTAKEEESLRHAMTDAQGHFTLEGLPAGRFVVEVVRDSDGTERTSAKPVELRGSEQAEVALRFEGGRTLSGITVDGNGEPIADTSVRVEVSYESAPSWRRHIFSCQTGRDLGVRTGPDGRFTLKHLIGDTHTLSVWKEGYTFVPARAQGGEPSRGGDLRVSKGTTEVRLVLERQARIRGRLVGPDGAPLRHFGVNGDPQMGPAGTFEWPFEKSGTQRLEFTAPNLAPMMKSVAVQQGVDVDLGDVRMGPGRRVTGRVLDAETGAPIAEARVQVIDLPQDPEEFDRGSSSSTETREDGTFELLRVDARPLMLEARHEDYRVGRVSLGSSEESVMLRLESGARLELTLRDPEGKPLSGVVTLERQGSSGRRVISVRGGTQVSQGMEPGLYVASVISHSQGVFFPQQVRIPASGRVGLSFVERRDGAKLVLHAEGATGAILLMGVEPPPVSEEGLERWVSMGQLTSEEKGVLTFKYLPPGHATVLLTAPGSPPRFHLEELELPAEGVVERELHPDWQPLLEK